MSKNFVEIDADPWLTADGNIATEVYFGRACEPAYTKSVTLKDLIDKELESFISPKTNKIAKHHDDDIKNLVKSLKRAVKYAEKRAKEMGYER